MAKEVLKKTNIDCKILYLCVKPHLVYKVTDVIQVGWAEKLVHASYFFFYRIFLDMFKVSAVYKYVLDGISFLVWYTYEGSLVFEEKRIGQVSMTNMKSSSGNLFFFFYLSIS